MTKTESIITDIYDAWRAQDLEWLASYLPDDFSHMVYVPREIHPLGGLYRGKTAALQRWAQVAQEFDVATDGPSGDAEAVGELGARPVTPPL